MPESPVEQLCVNAVFSQSLENGPYLTSIDHIIENLYRLLQKKAEDRHKALIGVNQTIQTNVVPSQERVIVVSVFLVGSAVDVSVVEANRRMEQFAPKATIRH